MADLINTPDITQTPPQTVAAIHVTVPRDQIQMVMGPGLGEIFGAIKAQGLCPAGPWLMHHLRMAPDVFDFEICIPVSAPIKPMGRVVPRELPALTVARTIFHGSYEHLSDGWRAFDAWMTANHHVAAPDLYEVYTRGPESSANPAEWRTELRRPLKDAAQA
jgi:effector-binding domain-containing protein